MKPPYRYVRFRYDPLNLKEAEAKIKSEGFQVELHRTPRGGMDLSFNTDWNRDHLNIAADTLEAFLTKGAATLLQRKSARFTARDIVLRAIVFNLYPHNRQAGIPLYSSTEPEFETE